MASSIYFLFILLISYNTAQDVLSNDTQMRAGPADWNHGKLGEDWTGVCRSGKAQTPIALGSKVAHCCFFGPSIEPIKLTNYYSDFNQSSILTNKGYTVSMKIGYTVDGKKPTISGSVLKGKYVAEELHFHWGSKSSPGSEHIINDKRFDLEMHIVHRNTKYNSIEEAVSHSDGLAVLGVFVTKKKKSSIFNILDIFDLREPGLSVLFIKLPEIIEYKSKVKISANVTLNDLLADLNAEEFYTYQGSLTTPPCSEAVTWIVYHNPLTVPYEKLSKIYKLKNQQGQPIVNTYRALQTVNDRQIKKSQKYL